MIIREIPIAKLAPLDVHLPGRGDLGLFPHGSMPLGEVYYRPGQSKVILWMLVDETAPATVLWRFEFVATGMPIPEHGRYMGTVWNAHLFVWPNDDPPAIYHFGTERTGVSNTPRRVSDRGFRVFQEPFTDTNRHLVSVIESSIAFEGPHCRIYVDDACAHLSLEQARLVRDALSLFIREAGAGELTEQPLPESPRPRRVLEPGYADALQRLEQVLARRSAAGMNILPRPEHCTCRGSRRMAGEHAYDCILAQLDAALKDLRNRIAPGPLLPDGRHRDRHLE